MSYLKFLSFALIVTAGTVLACGGAGTGESGPRNQPQARLSQPATPMMGNPDQEFVQKVLLTEKSVVETAKLYLRQGKDPQALRLAKRLVRSQSIEMAPMREWLSHHAR